MSRIILLSEAIGAGHERAASAIEEAFLNAYPNVSVTRINLLDTFRPLIAKVTRTLYLQALMRRPDLWGKWYEWQRDKEWSRMSRSIVLAVLRKAVSAWLRQLAPDAVICTHPLPACLIAEIKRKERNNQFALCTVLTDFDIHGYWTHPEIDLYCVPMKEMASVLQNRTKGRSRIRLTGIPISLAFDNASCNNIILSEPRKKQVLIMGGGLGIGIFPVVNKIIEHNLEVQITVVCGSNQALYQELTELYGTRSNINILGYTNQVAELMAESDVLVTKPGGLTVSEAIAMRLPMVLYSPIPGQEWRNGQILSKLGIAYNALTPEEGADYVRILLETDSLREQMKKGIESVRHPFAALEVANAVMEMVEPNVPLYHLG